MSRRSTRIPRKKWEKTGMFVIRDVGTNHVEGVFFPNGVTIKPQLKVQGPVQIMGTMNAKSVKEDGVPVVPAVFDFSPNVMLVESTATSIANPDRLSDIAELISGFGYDGSLDYEGYASADSNATGSFVYHSMFNQLTASANGGQPLYLGVPKGPDTATSPSNLAVTGTSGSISFYTSATSFTNTHLALTLEFDKNAAGDLRYRCTALGQYVTSSNSEGYSSASDLETLRSIIITNPFLVRTKDQNKVLKTRRSFSIKKLEPGASGTPGPTLTIAANPQPLVLSSDTSGTTTLSSNDKVTVSSRISADLVSFDRPTSDAESIAPTNDLNFSIDLGGNNKPSATFVDTDGTAYSISGGSVTTNSSANPNTISFSNGGTERLRLTIAADSGNNAVVTVTVASAEITSGKVWQSVTVDLDVYIKIDGAVIPSNPGFPLALQIVKNFPGAAGSNGADALSVELTRETISIATDYLGRHPTLKVQYNNYGGTGADDNVPTTAFTKISANLGSTSLTFGGHQTTGNPSNNTYQIVSGDIVIKSIGPSHERTLVKEFREVGSYPNGGSGSTATISVSDTDYHIFGLNTQTVFAIHISSDSNDAKISVSVLDWTDGTTNNPDIQDASLFDSVEVSVPIKVNAAGTVTTETRTFTVQKNKASAPTAEVVLNPSSVVLPANSSGVVSSHSEGNATINVFAGTDQLTTDNSSPYGTNTFRVGSPTATNITAGTVNYSGVNATSNPSSMSSGQDTASISFPVTVNVAGTETTINAVQSFGKSKAGADASGTETARYDITTDNLQLFGDALGDSSVQGGNNMVVILGSGKFRQCVNDEGTMVYSEANKAQNDFTAVTTVSWLSEGGGTFVLDPGSYNFSLLMGIDSAATSGVGAECWTDVYAEIEINSASDFTGTSTIIGRTQQFGGRFVPATGGQLAFTSVWAKDNSSLSKTSAFTLLQLPDGVIPEDQEPGYDSNLSSVGPPHYTNSTSSKTFLRIRMRAQNATLNYGGQGDLHLSHRNTTLGFHYGGMPASTSVVFMITKI